jgi:hypothetical protein
VASAGSSAWDPWADVTNCPPLASIFYVNRVDPAHSSPATALPDSHESIQRLRKLADALPAYLSQLNDRISSDIFRADYSREASHFSAVTDSASPVHAANFQSKSKYRSDYAIQTFENVCLDFASTTLIFVQPPGATLMKEMTAARENREKFPVSWIPFRYFNDQYKVASVERVNASWLVLPPDSTLFHQLTWDMNPGHQFHWMVWPMHMALNFPREFGHPRPDYAIVREACPPLSANDPVAEYLGVRTDQWVSVDKLWARIALALRHELAPLLKDPKDTRPRAGEVTLLHAPTIEKCRAPGEATLCVPRLVLADTHDQFMDKSRFSADGIRALRDAALRFLRFSPPPVPSVPGERPYRVLIYSRHDSKRRKIENVPEIIAALPEPRFIVRHVPNFGSRPAYEQFAAYAHTDIFIAPHGAHMTWISLLPRGAVILECHADPKVKFSWIPRMAAAVGAVLITHEAIGNPAQTGLPDLRDMDRDFKVNISAMCAEFAQAGIVGCKA